MKTRVSIAVAGLAALLASYSPVTVTFAEATNSTSITASASSLSDISVGALLECHEEFFCKDISRSECYGTGSAGPDITDFSDITQFNDFTGSTSFTNPTESPEFAEYKECIEDINYNYSSPTLLDICNIYSEVPCCYSLLDLPEDFEETSMGYFACLLDAFGCSSEYYSCVEDFVAEGSASSDAAVTTGNDQLSSRLVCAAGLIFTGAFAMFM